MRALLVVLVLAATPAAAQEPSPADMTLLGMRLGKSTLQQVLAHFGVAPLRHGDVDELCYRSETPLESTWVVFGSGEKGDWEVLTQFRVLSTQPPDTTCRPTPLIAPPVVTEGGIRIGMPAAEVKARLGPALRVTVDNGRVTSYEMKLSQ